MNKNLENHQRLLFYKGESAVERFEDKKRIERGIKWRIKHDFLGISLHDSELMRGLQEGHKHTGLYEAIMLLEGRIKVLCWDSEGDTEVKLLSERGDLVVIPPHQSHTLIVEEETRIIVVRFPLGAEVEETREKVSLPQEGLKRMREEILKAENKIETLLKQTPEPRYS